MRHHSGLFSPPDIVEPTHQPMLSLLLFPFSKRDLREYKMSEGVTYTGRGLVGDLTSIFRIEREREMSAGPWLRCAGGIADAVISLLSHPQSLLSATTPLGLSGDRWPDLREVLQPSSEVLVALRAVSSCSYPSGAGSTPSPYQVGESPNYLSMIFSKWSAERPSKFYSSVPSPVHELKIVPHL